MSSLRSSGALGPITFIAKKKKKKPIILHNLFQSFFKKSNRNSFVTKFQQLYKLFVLFLSIRIRIFAQFTVSINDHLSVQYQLKCIVNQLGSQIKKKYNFW